MIATKAQELEALKKIQKIVEDLGTDSYLSITFEGCFEQAKENIENDWGNNYKAMYNLSNKDLCDVRIAFQEVEANNRELESKNENLKSEIECLQSALTGQQELAAQIAEAKRLACDE